VPPAGALFPDGPTLARSDYSEQTDLAASQRAVVRMLQSKFHGKMIGVVRRSQDAQLFRDAGMTTLVLGELDKGSKLKHLKNWKEVPAHLP
jgi:hypothetical protein